MYYFKNKIFTVFFLFISLNITAQNSDSLHKDSLRIYKKIKHFAYKYKVTTLLYDAVFVDPEPKEYPAEPVNNQSKNINPYLIYKGRIIRNIHISVLSPFGFSVNDSTAKRINTIQKAGNRLHINTRHWIIINRLLFHENDSLNALTISETERILRGSGFINDARIFLTPTKNKDSVDVNVIVQDKWPLTVPILITDISGNVRFRNQNLFGLGQQFEHYVGFKRPNFFEFNGYYSIANIDNTYISSQLNYRWDPTGADLGLSFDRGFFSPLSVWAGGASITRYLRYYNYTDSLDELPKHVELHSYNYDFWLGRSFKLSKNKTFFNQSTNILTGLRFYNTRFIERPPFSIDKAMGNQNTYAVIGNVGIAVQQYYKDKFIYRFGATEDVPEGLIVQYIYGLYKKEMSKIRYYSGIEIARAKHFKFGYLSATLAEGIFFNKGVSNDITTNFKLYYFSDLKKNGDWFFRQFINYNFLYGQNKISGETTTLYGNELYGFNGTGLSGNTKMSLNSETVAYMPYNIIGFRLAPILMVGMGMIGDPANRIKKSRLYQGYSLGIMFRNENLLSSTFQISFGFYPFLPEGKNNVLAYNPVTSFTLRVRSFAVSKPEFIQY